MAKFNIEVNLDWMDEEGIDEALKKEIIGGIRNSLSKQAQEEINNKLTEIVQEESEKIISEYLGNTFRNTVENLKIPYKSSDWGSKVEYIPLSEYIGTKYENHLNKKVYNREGRIPDYERDAKLSISEYLIQNYIEKELTKKVETLIQKARKDAEDTVIKTLEETLKAQLSVDIIKRLDIPNMLRVLQEKAELLQG